MRERGWKRDVMRLRRLEDIAYRAPYTEERLQAARSEADPLADRVIAELYQTCQVRKPDDLLSAVRERSIGSAFPDGREPMMKACPPARERAALPMRREAIGRAARRRPDATPSEPVRPAPRPMRRLAMLHQTVTRKRREGS